MKHALQVIAASKAKEMCAITGLRACTNSSVPYTHVDDHACEML